MGLLEAVQDRGASDVTEVAGRSWARFHTVIASCLILLGSWYWMQIVHESGHALFGIASGGHVQRVVLEFFSFSRTDVEPNPHPLVVAWGGPVAGVAIPLVAWQIVRRLRAGSIGVPMFFAGFCLVANGAYIGAGSFAGIGDAGDMLALGSPRWLLWLVGTVCVVAGIVLWHALGVKARSSTVAASMWPPLVFAISAIAIVVIV